MSGHAHHPGNRVEDVAQNTLEGDTEYGRKQGVQRSDQRDKANQHRGNDNCNLETRQNVFTQHFEEALSLVQV